MRRCADVNLSSLDGKARLAERCQAVARADSRRRVRRPDEAAPHRTHRRRRACQRAETHVPAQRARSHRRCTTPKRSLVRSAIALLLQQPSLALALEPPYRFAALRQPGVELLSELVRSCASGPTSAPAACSNISATARKPRRCTSSPPKRCPATKPPWQTEFLDTMVQLEKQTVQQRIDELQEKQREGGLDDRDKDELRGLLLTRA